jgi:hypothetical protein
MAKENLADILHEIGEAVPLITRQSLFRLSLEDLTGGILSCVLATGRPRPAVLHCMVDLKLAELRNSFIP